MGISRDFCKRWNSCIVSASIVLRKTIKQENRQENSTYNYQVVGRIYTHTLRYIHIHLHVNKQQVVQFKANVKTYTRTMNKKHCKRLLHNPNWRLNHRSEIFIDDLTTELRHSPARKDLLTSRTKLLWPLSPPSGPVHCCFSYERDNVLSLKPLYVLFSFSSGAPKVVYLILALARHCASSWKRHLPPLHPHPR